MNRYRKATLQDVDAIVELVESAYRGEASRAGWTTEADLLDGQRTDADEVSRLIQQEDSLILMCERNGVLAASVHLHKKPDSTYLGMFAVQPGLQGGGIGRCLLTEAEQYVLNEWQCRLLRMLVISQRKELVAWYQRRGYRATGKMVPFPYGDARYGLPRRDDLVLMILEKRLIQP